MKNIVFTGGGTGGHVYPAEPIIRKIREQGHKIYWIGSKYGIEKDIVQSWELHYKGISTGKLRRYFSFQNFTDIFRILWGIIQSYFLLRKLKPAFVFSKGGFVSVPPVLAARMLGIPSYTHDSDVSPGLATRINHKSTKMTFLAYSQSKELLGKNNPKILVSGNPVRSAFFDTNPPLSSHWKDKINGKNMILVLGGSSGARQINELIQQNLKQISKEFLVIHQMGGELYREGLEQKNYIPLPYIHEDLPGLLKEAVLVVSRAGAGSLWEFAVTATPSLLIPLKVGSRGDQVQNAEIMKINGMAEILEDEQLTVFSDILMALCSDQHKLEEMANNCRKFLSEKAEDVMMKYLQEDL